jgi:hypothetical protein
MALDFDENISAPKRVDEKLRSISGTLGSTRVSRVGFGVSPERSL